MNKIHCGDFLHVSKKLRSEKFAVVIGDPPYNIGKDFGNNSDSRSLPDYIDWTKRWLSICFNHLADNGVIYVYGFAEILAHIAVQYPLDKQRWLVWHYTNKTVPSSKFWQRSHESILCLWKNKRPKLNIDAIREPYTEAHLRSVGNPRAKSKGRFSRADEQTFFTAHENGALPRDVLKIPALAGGAGKRERWFVCQDCGHRLFAGADLSEHSGHNIIQHPTQKPMALTRRLLLSVGGGGGRAARADPLCGGRFGMRGGERTWNAVLRHGDKQRVCLFRTKMAGRKFGVRMYRLTPRMLQHLRKDLVDYHRLFTGGRCSGWELEELIVRAVRSDTQANHHVIWKEAGHDSEADIRVRTNGIIHDIQIKSGKISKREPQQLIISGYRLGSYKGDFVAITKYLQSKTADFLSIPYEQLNGEHGRTHQYSVAYLDIEHLRDIDPNGWHKAGSRYHQSNESGILFTINPSMSWQIWWKIPVELANTTKPIVIH